MEIKKAVKPTVEKKVAVKPEKKPVKKTKPKTAFDKLVPARKIFVKAYLKNAGNATRSYIEAYPKAKYDTAKVEACKLLTNPNIKQAIDDGFNKIWEEKDKEIGQTFSNLIKMANANIADVVDYEDGQMKIKDFKDIDTSIIQQVSQSISVNQFGENINSSIKIVDKQKAISELLRVLNMIQDKVEHSGTIEILPATKPE